MIAFVLLFGMLLLGVHIPFAIGLAALFYILLTHGGEMLIVIPQVMFNSVDVFSFLAIPGFILAGDLMSETRITNILVDFVRKIIGRIPGGLAHVNVLASIFFAGISGSALADAAGLGSVEVPMMVEGGYSKEYSGAVTAASSVIGPIIPPSVVMVIYALIAGNVSIGAMFLAGYLPGILMGLLLMAVIAIDAKVQKLPRDRKYSLKEIIHSLRRAIIPLLMPLIIMGGILFGVFTATEAAVVAVFYALIVGVFILKTIKFRDLPRILLKSAKTTGVACIMVTMAKVLAWFLAEQQLIQLVGSRILSLVSEQNAFLAMLLLFYLLIGCVLDNTSAMTISVPILLPIALQLGVHPLHFGIITNVAMCIGLITPPVGACLFITCKVADVSFETLARRVLPFLLAEIVCLLLITYIPDISLSIPRFFGFI